jgi:hypothetical protein
MNSPKEPEPGPKWRLANQVMRRCVERVVWMADLAIVATANGRELEEFIRG